VFLNLHRYQRQVPLVTFIALITQPHYLSQQKTASTAIHGTKQSMEMKGLSMKHVRRTQIAKVMTIEQLESTDIYANKQLTQERVRNAVGINSAKKEQSLPLGLINAWMGPVH